MEIAVLVDLERCIKSPVLIAARKQKFLSNPMAQDRFTVGIAIQNEDQKDTKITDNNARISF